MDAGFMASEGLGLWQSCLDTRFQGNWRRGFWQSCLDSISKHELWCCWWWFLRPLKAWRRWINMQCGVDGWICGWIWMNMQQKARAALMTSFTAPSGKRPWYLGIVTVPGFPRVNRPQIITCGGRILTLHLDYVAGYTCPLIFLFERPACETVRNSDKINFWQCAFGLSPLRWTSISADHRPAHSVTVHRPWQSQFVPRCCHTPWPRSPRKKGSIN